MSRLLSGIVMFIIFLLILFFLASFLGCQTAPDREDYNISECFYSADCVYRNKDNPDKAICDKLVEACRDACKEDRTYKRLKHCAENKYTGMSEAECRLFLNQR